MTNSLDAQGNLRQGEKKGKSKCSKVVRISYISLLRCITMEYIIIEAALEPQFQFSLCISRLFCASILLFVV